MKSIFVFFILVLFVTSTYSESYLYSVFFVNSNTGFAVGVDWSLGTNLILKTTNGGNSWMVKSFGENCVLYSVYFTDENTGYAVGEDLSFGGGIIFRTTNGGNSWVSQTTEQGNALLSVHFPNSDTGYIAGADFFQGSTIKKTTDGGINWINQVTGSSEWLRSVYFLSSNIGYAAGENGVILKTTNGGNNWETLQSGTTNFLSSVYFTSLTTGYVAGENGTILKTTDGGISWQNQASGTNVVFRSICFTDTSTGFLVGDNGTILKTTNSGISWDTQQSGTSGPLRSVHFPNNNDGYVVGIIDTLLKTSNAGNNWNSLIIKTIAITSPNGGEAWLNGELHTIKWNANLIENVKIELSVDNGATWETVDDSYPNTGEFFWIINIPMYSASEECLIKISDVTDSIVYDISNEAFTIEPVGITVISPNGGEVWLNGSIQNITWISENLGSSYLRIKLSTDNGQNWNSMAFAVPNTGTYSWLVNSNSASEECLIRIETLNHNFYDDSDSIFTIEIIQAIEDNISEEQPADFNLSQNYPNPFNPSTIIKYQIPEANFVSLIVYNVLGNEIEALVYEEKPTGTYEVEFSGNGLPSGIYFYKLQAGSFVETRKMILLK